MKSFEELLLEYGLVQFGRFADRDGEFVPFKLNLDWMVSYPDVLKAAAFDVQDHFRFHDTTIYQFERILCPVAALPVATQVSVSTGIPLVYSRGLGEPAVQDLVGAYDINHPTLMLTTTDSVFQGWRVQADAHRVGLHITYSLALVEDFVPLKSAPEEYGRSGSIIDIITLSQIAVNSAYIITESQQESVREWVDIQLHRG